MERHGYCRTCHGPVHEYPAGIEHTFVPEVTHEPVPVWDAEEDAHLEAAYEDAMGGEV